MWRQSPPTLGDKQNKIEGKRLHGVIGISGNKNTNKRKTKRDGCGDEILKVKRCVVSQGNQTRSDDIIESELGGF